MNRILYNIRWYILLGSFVIFPLTIIVGFGCRFLNVGFENQDEVESFGAFSVAIYDPQGRGDNNFLGCVRPSQYWQEEVSYDVGFTTLKIASAFMLAFSIVATLICVCLQCFSKHGKTHLWGIMRFCYIGAAVSQGVMYTVFVSELCQTDVEEDDDSNFKGFLLFNLGNKKCSPGYTGILGVINFALLFGMVIATFNSLPPRNPVFQCWGDDMDWDEDSENGSTSEEDSEMKQLKSMVSEDSVSLFSSSRRSRRSVRSAVKNAVEDAASAAEKGVSTKSVGTKKSSLASSRYEKYVIAEEGADEIPVKKAEEVAVETADSPSASTAKSKLKFPGMAKFLKKNKDKATEDNISVASSKTSKSKTVEVPKQEVQIPSDSSIFAQMGLKTMSSALSSAISSNLSNSSGATLEVTNFVIQLIEMTELEEGGRRVKMADIENQVEIVDEYPKVPGGEIESSDSDVAVVRTEFYDLGSRTIKTITHKDSSKTIVTTILVEHGLEPVRSLQENTDPPPQYPKLLESPVEMTYSAASIESHNSSKYQVTAGPSSVTSYKGTGKKKEILGQGDLALSVGTQSVKSAAALKRLAKK